MQDTRIFPLTIIRDRYDGRFSGGVYLAFNCLPEDVEDSVYDEQYACWLYWQQTPRHVGRGDTPEEAERDLWLKLTDDTYQSPRTRPTIEFKESVRCEDTDLQYLDVKRFVELPLTVYDYSKRLKLLNEDTILLTGEAELVLRTDMNVRRRVDYEALYRAQPDAFKTWHDHPFDLKRIGHKPIRLLTPVCVNVFTLERNGKSYNEDMSLLMEVLETLGYTNEFGVPNGYTFGKARMTLDDMRVLKSKGLCAIRLQTYGMGCNHIFVYLTKEEALKRNVYKNREGRM